MRSSFSHADRRLIPGYERGALSWWAHGRHDDLECVAIASDGIEALDLVQQLAPDVVLMDLRMPGLNGIEATRRILAGVQADAGPRIVVLTTLRQDAAVVQALAAGASAFLTKDATPERVVATIRAAHDRAALPDVQSTLAIVDMSAPVSGAERSTAPLDVLSPREREVFLMVARGLSNAEIATSAYVTTATVKTHIAAILRKLELRSRVQVVVYAHRHGFVTG